MAFLIGGANSAAADTAFSVANSCRFNDGDSSYMHKTPGGAGDRRQWTFSAWIKRGVLGTSQYIFNSKNGSADQIFFNTDDKFQVGIESISADYVTTAIYRDTSAWYHFVAAVDTDQGTAANRVRVYVNGTEITSFSTETDPNQNTDTTMNTTEPMELGRRISGSTDFFDGYMAEVVFIDGTQYAASDFGEFDEDSPTIWKPKDVSGLTFGTNGFYLDFEDSSNLGNDVNGGTDLTESNLAATDQSTDTPTNNFATLNPLVNGATLSEGNCKIVTTNADKFGSVSTIGMTAGKWYFEVKLISATSSDVFMLGITGDPGEDNRNNYYPGQSTYGIAMICADGAVEVAGSASSYGDASTDNDIIGVALDLDNNKLYFAKNGTWQNSSDPTSGATGTGAVAVTAVTSTTSGAYHFIVGDGSASHNTSMEINFGNPPYANSSSVADANGYGAFEYAPPSGYLALCTKNLGSDGG